MSYDPTVKPVDMDSEVEEAVKKGDGLYEVQVSLKKTKMELLKTYINSIRSIDKHDMRVLGYGMWLNAAYVLYGLLGLITLTWYQPIRLTAIPSLKLSRELARVGAIRKQAKEREEQLKKEQEIEAVIANKPTHPQVIEDDMETWMKKMRGEEC
jgi:hypothetical protein